MDDERPTGTCVVLVAPDGERSMIPDAGANDALAADDLPDELLVPEIARLHAENYGVYGVRKMHALMRRQGWEIGRDQTARLMKVADVRGVKRSKKVFTTKPDPAGTASAIYRPRF